MAEETNTNQEQNTQGVNQTPPAFDYDKLAGLINGKQTVTEDTVLKSYFKQQGLSSDEVAQAISSFKETKAKNTPDISKLQSDITAAKTAQVQAVVNQHATIEAVKQGVDVKSIPYLLKMADFTTVTDDNGAINAEKMTEAIKTVLEDIPALKGSSAGESTGVNKIGGDGEKDDDKQAADSAIRKALGLK